MIFPFQTRAFCDSKSSRIKQKCEKFYIKMSNSEADLINWVSIHLSKWKGRLSLHCTLFFISSEDKRVYDTLQVHTSFCPWRQEIIPSL